MTNATYASRLCYLDADDVTDPVVDYDGLDVYAEDGQKIGDIDGFIVDREARRVNYVVVDSGGWFRSRRLLVPIGHATLSDDRKSLQTDVSREALGRLPEFDEDRFQAFTDDELRAFERNTVVACCPDESLEEVSATTWGYDSRRHYQQPEWWGASRYSADRLRQIARDAYRPEHPASAQLSAVPSRDAADRDLVTARERATTPQTNRGEEVSPHPDRRAQPGDVLGIETGGERTQVGDTAEDEDKVRGAGDDSRRR